MKFFKQFDLVYNCLDNAEARSYVNLRCLLAKVPIVDGGSAGFLGQSWVFQKECYECVEKNTEDLTVCTVRSVPKKYSDCVVWAKTFFLEKMNCDKFDELIEEEATKRMKMDKVEIITDLVFKKDYKSKEYEKEQIDGSKKKMNELLKKGKIIFDKDDEVINDIVYIVSTLRATSFGLETQTRLETETLAGNIIPAVSTTNAIIASLMFLTGEKILKNEEYYNYYIMRNKNILGKTKPEKWNLDCRTCGVEKYIFESNEEVDVDKIIDIAKSLVTDVEISIFKNNILLYDKFCKNENYIVKFNEYVYIEGKKTILIYFMMGESGLYVI